MKARTEQRITKLWMLRGGLGCLLGLVTLAATLILIFKSTRGMLKEFDELGFTRIVQSRSITITNTLVEPTLFMAETVVVDAPCTTSLAIVARSAQINAQVDGTLYFRGHTIVISETGLLKNELNANANTIENNGTILGDITGK